MTLIKGTCPHCQGEFEAYIRHDERAVWVHKAGEVEQRDTDILSKLKYQKGKAESLQRELNKGD